MSRWISSALVALSSVFGWGACADAPIELPPPVAFVPPAETMCHPRKWVCLSEREEALCSFDGTYWQATDVCAEDETCTPEVGSRCFKPICIPGQTRCATSEWVQECGEYGEIWNNAFRCDPGYVCAGGRCTLASCLSDVLFVVDRSGSMEPHWSSVRQATLSVVRSNDSARFGVLGFPAVYDSPCSASGEPQVALSTHDLEGQIEAFFDQAPQGSTPLVETLESVRASAGSIFGSNGGALVVLTDGGDTCAPPSKTHPAYLSSLASKLFDGHGIKTYVVGYRFSGSVEQLKALARGGGTEYDDFIAAGSVQELADAFTAIVSDWKLCF